VSPDSRRQWAAALESEARLQPATALWQIQALPKHGRSIAEYILHAKVLTSLARYSESASLLKQGLRQARSSKLEVPVMVLFFAATGDNYREQGMLWRAEQWYRKIMLALPSSPVGYVLTGTVLARRGQHVAALKLFRRATLLRRIGLEEAYCNVGLSLRALGRLRQARDAFRKALGLDPTFRVAQTALKDVSAALRLAGRTIAKKRKGRSRPKGADD